MSKFTVLVDELRTPTGHKWAPLLLRLEVTDPVMIKPGFLEAIKTRFKVGEREKVTKYWQFPYTVKARVVILLDAYVGRGNYDWRDVDDPSRPYVSAYTIESELSNLRSQLSSAAAQLESSNAVAERYRIRCWNLEDEVDDLKAKLHEIESGTDEQLRHKITELEDEIARLRFSCDMLRSLIRNRPDSSPAPKKISPLHAALCVSEDAPPELIRAAYKVLAMLHHPDRGGDTRRMQEINAAYEKLAKQ